MYFPIARIWLRRNYKAAGPDNIPSQALDYGIPVHYGTFSLYSLFFLNEEQQVSRDWETRYPTQEYRMCEPRDWGGVPANARLCFREWSAVSFLEKIEKLSMCKYQSTSRIHTLSFPVNFRLYDRLMRSSKTLTKITIKLVVTMNTSLWLFGCLALPSPIHEAMQGRKTTLQSNPTSVIQIDLNS